MTIQITKRKLKKKDAPRSIVLPDPLVAGMQQSWARSRPDGGAQEQGGNLVRNRDGSYAWRQGKAGSAGVYLPDSEDVGKGQKLVGIGHTHPYESGQENVSFSGDDISSLVDEEQPLNILQSGKTLFVIARTAEFDSIVADLDDDQARDLRERIETTWVNVFKAHKGTFPEKAEAATIKTCQQFKLVYYRGQGKALERIE